ncbi:methylamine dehydrogenase accessory protein MauD [Caballeronia pedi]|uniref:Methylamine dehydrogenase accessory protein MauD n=1 Tax=Caballeronia pedi TaxID=1777141 RepID=A0A158CR21_9BURK|nr:redoxin domain-containing protein [Caballeronia pedi]SAK84805.1 methylamine dehydrogenase accessory protein MauD [Caballeronia pedi]
MTTLLVFALALPWLLIVFGCWLGYQLVRQHGRILLSLARLEQGFAGGPAEPLVPASTALSGLPLGSMAPDFELPDLSGALRRLSEFRGRPVLLIFFNPACRFCTSMVPELAAFASEGQNGKPALLVISTGESEANRQLFQTHGIGFPVLLEKDMEVAAQYQAHGTPVGYLLDETGVLASELAMGAAALMALATSPTPQAAPESGHEGPSKPAARGNIPLDKSRLNRSGLKAGTPAPNFRLPSLDGNELALENFRGQRVLLVFTDPGCGPCELLAPHLERVNRERKDLLVLMVSRQDAEINRQKVAKLGLTFLVVLQRNWEVSLLYATFATPVGYLIDERGILGSDVAEGSDAILALAASPSVSSTLP